MDFADFGYWGLSIFYKKPIDVKGVSLDMRLSQIPGDNDHLMLFGALIAYRIIYYLLPLIVSAVALVVYETYLGVRRRKMLIEIAQK